MLDTCAVIWLAQGAPMAPAAREAIRRATMGDGAYISAVSVWEIGLLARPRGKRTPMAFLPDLRSWLDRVFAEPGLREAPLTRAIAHLASALPGEFHADPADRFVVATALTLGMPVVTRDRAVLEYARAGYVGAVEC